MRKFGSGCSDGFWVGSFGVRCLVPSFLRCDWTLPWGEYSGRLYRDPVDVAVVVGGREDGPVDLQQLGLASLALC